MKKIVIGIDVGISTTKIVGIDEKGMVISPIRIKATDPITSLYGAFGKYLHDNKIKLDEIEHVMLTGVGAAYIDEHIYGLPTSKSEEFIADGLGAKYESKLDRMIVVSMGTGTSLVKCDGENIKHIGGIGIGGGTLAGLSRIMLKTDDTQDGVHIYGSDSCLCDCLQDYYSRKKRCSICVQQQLTKQKIFIWAERLIMNFPMGNRLR